MHRTRTLFLRSVVAALVICRTTKAHEHYVPNADRGEDLADHRFTRDTRHIKEDIEKYFQMNLSAVDHLSQENLDYYYFVLHDFDRNNKLDGLEMLKAIEHAVDHADHIDEAARPSVDAALNSFSQIIDRTLEADDLDKDGYLSYAEFNFAQRRYQTQQATAPPV